MPVRRSDLGSETEVKAWPDWRAGDAYRYLLEVDRAGWAWEWLRRNPAYADRAPAEWGLLFRGDANANCSLGAVDLGCCFG